MELDKAGDSGNLLEVFRDTTGEALTDRELLTLILSFTDRAKYSNEIIDSLYDTFGSYSAIFKASHSELEKIPHISQKAVALIVILGKIYRDSMKNSSVSVGEYVEDVGRLFSQILDGTESEELWAAGFDDNGILVVCECIMRGTIDSISTYIASIADFASRNRVNLISVAHNHPTVSQLSDNSADTDIAFVIGNVLTDFNIRLQGFYIIDDEVHVLACDELDSVE